MTDRRIDGRAVDNLAPEVQISRAISRILRDITGRGAENAWTTINEDHVIVMLAGTLTPQERVLAESGHGETVTQMRLAVQDVVRNRSSRVVEEATGRRVEGFMSANNFSPDRAVEVFLLADESAASDDLTDDGVLDAAGD